MASLRCGRNILRAINQETSLKKSEGIVNPLLYAGHGVRYRKLEVILTTNIDKLGKAGEMAKVAPGYFRNYLMPKLLAVPNIDKFAHLVKDQRKVYEPKEAEEVKEVKDSAEDKLKDCITAARRLDKAKLVLRRFYKVDKEIRDPVSKEELISEVARQLNVHIGPENLYLPAPLSSLGEYEIPLRFPKSIPPPEGKIMWTLDVKIRAK